MEKIRREKMQVPEKGREVAKHCVLRLWVVEGRLSKAAGAKPAGQIKDEKLHTDVARSTLASQNVQNTSGSERFRKLSCRKSARVAGSTFGSKKLQNTSASDRFWKLRC